MGAKPKKIVIRAKDKDGKEDPNGKILKVIYKHGGLPNSPEKEVKK